MGLEKRLDEIRESKQLSVQKLKAQLSEANDQFEEVSSKLERTVEENNSLKTHVEKLNASMENEDSLNLPSDVRALQALLKEERGKHAAEMQELNGQYAKARETLNMNMDELEAL